MLRLVNDSGVLEEKLDDIKDVDFATMIEAVHKVQENMGITNTTVNEAATTLQGSAGAMGAAWQNLVAGLSDPEADLGLLIDNFVKSASASLTNLIPTISNALKGIGSVIQQIAPILSAELPGLVNSILPPLLQAAVLLINSLIQSLPSILGALKEVIPMILNVLLPNLIQALPDIVSVLLQVVTAVVESLAENMDSLIPMIIEVVLKIAEILTNPDVLVPLLDAGLKLVAAIIDGVAQAVPKLYEYFPKIVKNAFFSILELLPHLMQDLGIILVNLGMVLLNNIRGKWGLVKDIFLGIIDGIKTKFREGVEFIKDIVKSGIEKIAGFFAGLKIEFPKIKLPHFKLEGEFSLNPLHPSVPKLAIDWYAKAYDEAYLLNKATIFGAQGGKLLGGGEGNGSEVVVGTNKLISMMSQAVQNAMGGLVLQANVPVYIGNKKLEDIIVKTQATMKMKRGK